MTGMTFLTVAAIGIGLLYLAGGFYFLRQLALDRWVDALLGALGDTEAESEKEHTRMLTQGAAATFVSGLSLASLSPWTPVIFFCGTVVHGRVLFRAVRVRPPEDETERQGRRGSLNAFVLYLAVFAPVLYAHSQGLWRGWLLPGPEWLAAFAELAAMLGGTSLLVRFLHGAPDGGTPVPAPLPAPSGAEEADTPGRPNVLRFMPGYGCWPTWSLDDIPEPIDPALLGLSAGLLARIEAWDDAYQATFDDDPYKEPFVWEFPDVGAERAWVLEGRAIAEALRQEWGGPYMDAFSGLEDMLLSARRDLSPVEPLPMARAARVARHCRVVEIMDLLERLDALARDKDALCGLDGEPEQERVEGAVRVQEFFARVLAAVDERYTGELRRGLDSPQAQTREWVALALRWRQEAGGSADSRAEADRTP